MAKVAKQWIVWHSDPKTDDEGNALFRKVRGVESDDVDLVRIEVPMDGVVPDIVPEEIQEEWEKRGLVFEDPNRAHVAAPEGPPRVLMPAIAAQRIEHSKKIARIPPRPVT
jgi:hypothetical protein